MTKTREKKKHDIHVAARVFVRRGINIGEVDVVDDDDAKECDRAVLLFSHSSNDVARFFGVRRVRRVRESVDRDDG